MNERIIRAALLLSVAAMALAGVTAVALSQSTGQQGGNANNANGNTNRSNRNTNANAGGNTNTPADSGRSQTGGGASGGQSGGGTGGALSRADREFFREAAMSGMKEVELSRLAADRATSAQVKEFARRMVEDHTRTNQELMSLAASKGVTLPTAPDAKLRSALDKLGRRSGADFDRAYLKEAGAPAHEKAVRLFQREASGGSDPEVRAFASATLPALQEHLAMARALDGGNRGGSSNHNTNGSHR